MSEGVQVMTPVKSGERWFRASSIVWSNTWYAFCRTRSWKARKKGPVSTDTSLLNTAQTHHNVDGLEQIQHDAVLVNDRDRADPALAKDVHDIKHARLHRRGRQRPKSVRHAEARRRGAVHQRLPSLGLRLLRLFLACHGGRLARIRSCRSRTRRIFRARQTCRRGLATAVGLPPRRRERLPARLSAAAVLTLAARLASALLRLVLRLRLLLTFALARLDARGERGRPAQVLSPACAFDAERGQRGGGRSRGRRSRRVGRGGRRRAAMRGRQGFGRLIPGSVGADAEGAYGHVETGTIVCALRRQVISWELALVRRFEPRGRTLIAMNLRTRY